MIKQIRNYWRISPKGISTIALGGLGAMGSLVGMGLGIAVAVLSDEGHGRYTLPLIPLNIVTLCFSSVVMALGRQNVQKERELHYEIRVDIGTNGLKSFIRKHQSSPYKDNLYRHARVLLEDEARSTYEFALEDVGIEMERKTRNV